MLHTPPLDLPQLHARIRLATEADVSWLDWLQDRPFARDAGWLPRVALAGRVTLSQVLLIERSGQPAGYLIAAPRKDRKCHITQHVIDEECWRLGLGTALFNVAASSAEVLGSRSLTLRCAHGALANEFWPMVGLQHIADQAGQRRWLACWSRPLGFDGRIEMPPPSRRRVALQDLLERPPKCLIQPSTTTTTLR